MLVLDVHTAFTHPTHTFMTPNNTLTTPNNPFKPPLNPLKQPINVPCGVYGVSVVPVPDSNGIKLDGRVTRGGEIHLPKRLVPEGDKGTRGGDKRE